MGTAERQDAARAIARCKTLVDATKQEVRGRLGPPVRLEEQHPEEFEREWYYLIGETNSEFGPADEQNLVVRFDHRRRVKSVSVSPP